MYARMRELSSKFEGVETVDVGTLSRRVRRKNLDITSPPTKQGKMRTKAFKPWRIVAIRNWSVRFVRPHALLGAATGLVAQFRCGLWGWLVNRCVSAPHDGMRRRRRESHGWRGLARSGRVVGPREGDGSLIDARLVALVSINLGGSCVPLQMGKRVSERATRGGEGRNTAVSGHRIHVVRLGKPSEPVRTRRACFASGACGPGGSSAR